MPIDLPETFERDIFEAMEKPDEDWRRTIDDIRADLESNWGATPTAGLAFAIGYCWFHMPGHDPGDFCKAKEWFLRAVELESGHIFASFYLGCLFFEYQLWSESEHWLGSIPGDWFEVRDLAWRERKREEMLVCIRLMTDPEEVTGEHVQRLMAIHYDPPSVAVWPLPCELVETILRLKVSDPDNFHRLAPVLAGELVASGLAELFPDEIAELQGG